MKKIITFIFICINCSVFAQFSGDPANPLYVCNAANTQSSVASISDGNGGYYTFWLDKRNNSSISEVYGQHLDADGHELWTANGKRIVQSNTKTCTALRVCKAQNKILVTWVLAGDSILCKMINSNGNNAWSQPTLLATTGNGIIYVDVSGYNVFANDSGATVTFSYVFTGGSELFGFNRVDINGNLRWPVNNFTLTLAGYNFLTQKDGQNGFYTLAKGNGLGSGFNIYHYDLQGVSSWASPVDITGGGGLNGLGGNINMHNDAAGNLYVVWDAYNGRTLASKLNLQGTFAWNPAQVEMSSLVNTQSRCNSLLRGNNLYAVWNDGRVSGVTYGYMQKVDTSGTPAWTANGINIGEVNGYYNYTKLAYSDSNAVLAFYLGLSNIKVNAQRVRQDGSLTWAANGIDAVFTPGSWISYNDAVAIDDSDGCNALFFGSTGGDIVGTKICSDGVLVYQDENETGYFDMYPNPANDIVSINFKTEIKNGELSILFCTR